MKVFLLIYLISTHDAQPSVQKLEQVDMPSCQAQASIVLNELRHKGCDGKQNCTVPYIVRTQCVTAVN